MDEWPDWIHKLPAIDTPFPGGQGNLLASEHGQVVLWSFPEGAIVASHQHGPQIGVVVAGRVQIRIGDHTRICDAGGSFTIADQQPHDAIVAPGTLVIEIFADPDRHTPAPQQAR